MLQSLSASSYDRMPLSRTWEGLDIASREAGHEFCIDANAILPEWMFGDFYQLAR